MASTSTPKAPGAATPPTEISVFCRLIAVPARARPEISAAAVKARPFQLIVEMAAKASSGYRRTPGPVASAPTAASSAVLRAAMRRIGAMRRPSRSERRPATMRTSAPTICRTPRRGRRGAPR